MVSQVSLYFQQGSSDKEYHAQLENDNNGYVVNFQYGRRGNALKSGTKTAIPVSLQDAEKIYNKLVQSKIAKGYIPSSSNPVKYVGNANAPKKVVKLPQLLNMVFSAMEFINDDSYLAQEKKDGERRMVISSGSVTGLNKKGLEVPLPLSIVDAINEDCILDGEIIKDNLYVFDILSLNGKDLESLPCIERVEILNRLSFGAGIIIVPTAFTRKEKIALFRELDVKNKEGIVFKKKDAPYIQGRPSSGGTQVKFKFYKTATFIVSDMITGKRSVGLELVDNEDGRVFMGKVTIPPNKEIPNVGDFVEVRYLYAYRGGAIFQPTYLEKREDSDLTDATLSQIIYKSDEHAKGGLLKGELIHFKDDVSLIDPDTNKAYTKFSFKDIKVAKEYAQENGIEIVNTYSWQDPYFKKGGSVKGYFEGHLEFLNW